MECIPSENSDYEVVPRKKEDDLKKCEIYRTKRKKNYETGNGGAKQKQKLREDHRKRGQHRGYEN